MQHKGLDEPSGVQGGLIGTYDVVHMGCLPYFVRGWKVYHWLPLVTYANHSLDG